MNGSVFGEQDTIVWLKANGQISKLYIKSTPENIQSERMFYNIIGAAQPLGILSKSYAKEPYLRIVASYAENGQSMAVEHLKTKELERWMRQLAR